MSANATGSTDRPSREVDDLSPGYLPLPQSQRHGIALCLSGGGFRAALFHLGALRRLNELGVLAKLWTISSVSGGSFASAHMATRLSWPIPGRVEDWEDRIAAPLRALARRGIRAPLPRLLPWNWFRAGLSVETLVGELDRRLTPFRLTDLPGLPIFVFGATETASGRQWVFQRDQIGSDEPGATVELPSNWPLARAVAASACSAPLFRPMRLRSPEEVYLTDGSDSDGFAVEPVWRDHETLLVSDGGGLFGLESDRQAAILERQARTVRKRWLIASFRTGVLKGTYWGIGSACSRYDPADRAGYSRELAREVIASVRTDIDSFSEAEAAVLENHGYLLADAAMHIHVPELFTRPAPPPAVPHREWMSERIVRKELAESGRTRHPDRR